MFQRGQVLTAKLLQRMKLQTCPEREKRSFPLKQSLTPSGRALFRGFGTGCCSVFGVLSAIAQPWTSAPGMLSYYQQEYLPQEQQVILNKVPDKQRQGRNR
jgi:hypothetical protein